MKPGQIVEFTAGDEHRLGAVLDVIGKSKLLVVNAAGDQNRPARDDVTFTLAGAFDPADRDAALATVIRIDTAVTEHAEALDLASLWKLASPGTSHDIRELARLNGDGGGIAQIALARRLRRDDVYFRSRKGLFEARSADQVEDQLRQNERDQARGARREAFLSTVTAVLSLPIDQRAAAFVENTRDPDFGEWADLLRGFAADESTFPRREEASELLDDLERASGQRFFASASPRGFELMRALGLWGEHEVVAVHRFGLHLDHDPQVLELADEAAERGFDREERRDYTRWWTITVDHQDSRDIDDALSIRPTLDGGWEVAVHIADPDAFVPMGSPIDDAALARGASMYLPTGVAPMFPPVLSERAMSLLADVDRPAITTHINFDGDLEIEGWEISPSVVRVNRRISYVEADELLQGSGTDHLTSVLRDLAFVADELHARRLAHQAVTIELPEPHVTVTLGGETPDVHVDVVGQSVARNLVSEFMVFVGELTARWCAEREIPIIYRVQDPPHADRRDDALQRIPEGWARDVALLMTMQRAEASTHARPHAGLGLPMYTQTTSPIRRYGDLTVQRQVKAALRGDPLPYDTQDIFGVAQAAERTRNEAAVAEKEAVTYWILELLRRREGGDVDAVVVDSRDGGSRRVEVILTEYGFRTTARFRTRPAPGSRVRLRIDRALPRAQTLVLHEV